MAFALRTVTLKGLARAAVLLALVLSAATSPAGAQTPIDTVTTLAGSGLPGFDDGTVAASTFLMPSGVASGTNGDIYVADAASQRIRVIDKSGAVRTLAGGGELLPARRFVSGGMLDAKGSAARFEAPMGLAVAADGDLFVADMNNGAIRRVTADGTVTTFASGLGLPRQLAFAHDGSLYVADSKKGLLRISPAGHVETITNLNVKAPLGVAFGGTDAHQTLFVADSEGIVVEYLGQVARFMNTANVGRSGGAVTEGYTSIGTPYQLVGLNDRSVAYTDMRAHCVRYLDVTTQTTFVVAGSADAASATDGGSYLDGSGVSARFDAPMGIALARGGKIVVADAGNRRIREIDGFDSRGVTRDPLSTLAERRDPHQYRILYVGASNIWWATDWSSSIPGIVEHTVASDVETRTGRSARVVPVQMLGATLTAMASYISTAIDAGIADAVILQLNDGSIPEHLAGKPWQAVTAAELRRLDAHLRASHVPFVLVVEPLAFQVDPIERAWDKTVNDILLPANPDDPQAWDAVGAQSGVPTVDLFMPLNAELASAHHRALFASDDEHFSKYGRSVVGTWVGAALVRLHPWSAESPSPRHR